MTENLSRTTRASIQNGVARADGELVVTDTQLTFTPFNRMLGLGPYKFARSTIAKVEPSSSRILGLIPINHDAIKITLTDGQSYEFLLANSRQWLEVLSPTAFSASH